MKQMSFKNYWKSHDSQRCTVEPCTINACLTVSIDEVSGVGIPGGELNYTVLTGCLTPAINEGMESADLEEKWKNEQSFLPMAFTKHEPYNGIS